MAYDEQKDGYQFHDWSDYQLTVRKWTLCARSVARQETWSQPSMGQA